MFCFFGEKKKKKFVREGDAQTYDIETIMALYELDGEVKRLIQDYPEDDLLRRQYRQLPRKGCSRDPVKFKQLKAGLQDILQQIQAEASLDAFSLSIGSS